MIRDQRTQALLNTSVEDLNKYKMERDRSRKLTNMQLEIDHLKECVDKLYKLLDARIEKNNGKTINH
jgi:hypothetical protein